MRARLISQDGLPFAAFHTQEITDVVFVAVPDGTEGNLVTVAGGEHLAHWLHTDDDLWVPVKREHYELDRASVVLSPSTKNQETP